MSNKPDWATAPRDAQFYSCGFFRKHSDGREYKWNRGSWHDSRFDELEWHRNGPCDFEMRPESSLPDWSGQGLPPAGIECEYFRADFNRWVGCTTIGVFRDEMVCAPDGGDFLSGKEENFRPIKSDRDKWVDEANQMLEEMPYGHDRLSYLYDAMKTGKLPTP